MSYSSPSCWVRRCRPTLSRVALLATCRVGLVFPRRQPTSRVSAFTVLANPGLMAAARSAVRCMLSSEAFSILFFTNWVVSFEFREEVTHAVPRPAVPLRG